MERIAEVSPRSMARIAGVFEALEGLASASGQVLILGRLVIAGDAAATATSILTHLPLFWFGFALSLFGVAFHIVWIALFYDLFKPVNRGISLLAAFVGLVVCAMQALTSFLYLAPLLILQAGSGLSGFSPDQLHALAYTFVRLNAYSFDVDLAFFGLWCFVTGYLIFRSAFLPRILGVLLAIDGLGWMLFIHPPLAFHLYPFIAGASAIAEIPLQLWLIIMGVNPLRWKEQAAAAGQLHS